MGGSIYAPNALTGNCPDGLSASGGAGLIPGQAPPNVLSALSQPYLPPAPSIPAAGTMNVNPNANTSLSPGSSTWAGGVNLPWPLERTTSPTALCTLPGRTATHYGKSWESG